MIDADLLDGKIRAEDAKGTPSARPSYFRYIFSTQLDKILLYNLPEEHIGYHWLERQGTQH